VREYEELKRQMEEDADREILTLKTTYERKLNDERIALHVCLVPFYVLHLSFLNLVDIK